MSLPSILARVALRSSVILARVPSGSLCMFGNSSRISVPDDSDDGIDVALLGVGQLEVLLDVLVGEGLGALDLVLDLMEPVELLGLEEFLGGRVGLCVDLLADLLHLGEPLLALEALGRGCHLLPELRAQFLRLLDLCSVEFQLLLNTGVAQQHADAAAPHSPASAAPLLGEGRSRQQGDQSQCDARPAQSPHRV